MDVRSRRRLFTAVLVLFAAISITRLIITTQGEGGEEATIWIAALIVLAICAIVIAVVLRRVRGLAMHVEKQRPGVHVVPAFTTAETVDQAQAAGAATSGIMPMGGSPVALAVAGDVVEVWLGRETRPRWVVRRTPGGARSTSGSYGIRGTTALEVTDGNAAVTVVPAYRPLRATGGRVGEDVERAIREIAVA